MQSKQTLYNPQLIDICLSNIVQVFCLITEYINKISQYLL